MAVERIESILLRALKARADFFDLRQEAAFRLFNGFVEGCPELVVDLYGRTLVLYNYVEDAQSAQSEMEAAWHFYISELPWLQSVILKVRNSPNEALRRGSQVYGQKPTRRIREKGVWYTVDLVINMDASLYLDTRNLRAWEIERLAGKRVLNTFAYTGSLGVAALAGGARQVLQLDRNSHFLNLAKDSYALNGYPVRRSDFRAGDFWVLASQLRRAGELFDCVIVDPPFFSTTARGTVDLVSQSMQVINKVRPLIAHNGWLVTINNALYLSGKEYLELLHGLCADGYLTIEELIPAPADFTGFAEPRVGQPPVDPAPFNHSTKIAVLRARRKDELAA